MQLEVKGQKQALYKDERKRERRSEKTSSKRKRDAAEDEGIKEDPSPSKQQNPPESVEKQQQDASQMGTASPPGLPAGFATMVS